MSNVFVKGFVVGEAQPWIDTNGVWASRPKLVEVEVAGSNVHFLLAKESVVLDAEALASLRSMLDDAADVIA